VLYIVSTPIGNLKDITLRAIDTLKQVDLIAAEDTRHTKILCKEYGIETPLTSYFEHNQFKKGDFILKQLQDGRNVALVTDAGTPGISDPGYKLINLAKQHQIPVAVVPGAAALIAALSLSGYPSDRFSFEGFLPVKEGQRRKKLELLKDQDHTVIFYESPHRLLKSLEDIQKILPERKIFAARELTKKFEEGIEGSAADLIRHFSEKGVRGEFVLIIKGGS
jgi:16S rRNA (cytidine1402-2'-O)-methyltransferase